MLRKCSPNGKLRVISDALPCVLTICICVFYNVQFLTKSRARSVLSQPALSLPYFLGGLEEREGMETGFSKIDAKVQQIFGICKFFGGKKCH